MKIQNEDILLNDVLLSIDTDDVMKIRTLKEIKMEKGSVTNIIVWESQIAVTEPNTKLFFV